MAQKGHKKKMARIFLYTSPIHTHGDCWVERISSKLQAKMGKLLTVVATASTTSNYYCGDIDQVSTYAGTS